MNALVILNVRSRSCDTCGGCHWNSFNGAVRRFALSALFTWTSAIPDRHFIGQGVADDKEVVLTTKDAVIGLNRGDAIDGPHADYQRAITRRRFHCFGWLDLSRQGL